MSTKNVTVTVGGLTVAEAGFINWIEGDGTTYTVAVNFFTDYITVTDDAGGGAPADVDYLVGTASGSLSAEIVAGTAPGGELGGTWASPTVDTTHSGSSHAGVVTTHEAASDPHTGYFRESFIATASKSQDQSWTTDAALADVEDMGFAIGANETWVGIFYIAFTAGTTGDIQVAFTIPDGATMRWQSGAGNNTTVTNWTGVGGATSGSGVSFGGTGGNTGQSHSIKVINGATPGTVQLQAAQSVSNGTTTTILAAGTWLVAFRHA